MVTEAPAARAFRRELTRRYPGRNERSDGILPSAKHSRDNPTSRHEKGDAVDATHDPAAGCDMHLITEHVRQRAMAGDLPMVDEIIWQGRIATAAKGWRWRQRNKGPGDHTLHAHFSIVHSRRADTRPWLAFPPAVVRPHSPDPKPLEEDDMPLTDADVERIADAVHARTNKDVVTVLRGKDAPSLTRILALLTKIGEKLGVKP